MTHIVALPKRPIGSGYGKGCRVVRRADAHDAIRENRCSILTHDDTSVRAAAECPGHRDARPDRAAGARQASAGRSGDRDLAHAPEQADQPDAQRHARGCALVVTRVCPGTGGIRGAEHEEGKQGRYLKESSRMVRSRHQATLPYAVEPGSSVMNANGHE